MTINSTDAAWHTMTCTFSLQFPQSPSSHATDGRSSHDEAVERPLVHTAKEEAVERNCEQADDGRQLDVVSLPGKEEAVEKCEQADDGTQLGAVVVPARGEALEQREQVDDGTQLGAVVVPAGGEAVERNCEPADDGRQLGVVSLPGKGEAVEKCEQADDREKKCEEGDEQWQAAQELLPRCIKEEDFGRRVECASEHLPRTRPRPRGSRSSQSPQSGCGSVGFNIMGRLGIIGVAITVLAVGLYFVVLKLKSASQEPAVSIPVPSTGPSPTFLASTIPSPSFLPVVPTATTTPAPVSTPVLPTSPTTTPTPVSSTRVPPSPTTTPAPGRVPSRRVDGSPEPEEPSAEQTTTGARGPPAPAPPAPPLENEKDVTSRPGPSSSPTPTTRHSPTPTPTGYLQYLEARRDVLGGVSFLGTDREAVLAAVEKSGLLLIDATRLFQGDNEMVLAAVREWGLALRHVSETLVQNENDRRVVLAAVENDVKLLFSAWWDVWLDLPEWYEYSEKDAEIVREVLRNIEDEKIRNQLWRCYVPFSLQIKVLSEFPGLFVVSPNVDGSTVDPATLEKDAVTTSAGSSSSPTATTQQNQHADALQEPIFFRAPPGAGIRVVGAARTIPSPATSPPVIDAPPIVPTLSPDCQERALFDAKVWEELRKNGKSCRRFCDKRFVLELLKNIGGPYWRRDRLGPETVHCDGRLVRLNGRLVLEHTSADLQSDRDVVSAAVKGDGLALQFASEALQADEGIVLAAVKSNGLALQFASGALRANRRVVAAAVLQIKVLSEFPGLFVVSPNVDGSTVDPATLEKDAMTTSDGGFFGIGDTLSAGARRLQARLDSEGGSATTGDCPTCTAVSLTAPNEEEPTASSPPREHLPRRHPRQLGADSSAAPVLQLQTSDQLALQRFRAYELPAYDLRNEAAPTTPSTSPPVIDDKDPPIVLSSSMINNLLLRAGALSVCPGQTDNALARRSKSP